MQENLVIVEKMCIRDRDSVLDNLLSKYASLSDHIQVIKKNPDVYPTFAKQYTDETVQNNRDVDKRQGYVTGNVFGREIEGSIPVKMGKRDVERFMKTCTKGSQVMLDLEGQMMDVLVKEIDFDSMKNQVDEIDFQALVSGEKVHSVAEVILLNHEKRTEGVVEQMLQEISYKACLLYTSRCV